MKEKIKTKMTKEPDIAFWFSEGKEDTTFLVRVKEDIKHIQLIQACFDLLARAMKSDADTTIASWKEEE